VFYYSYAPWCPACQHLQADWENLGRQSESLGISVGRVDVTQQPGLTDCASLYLRGSRGKNKTVWIILWHAN